MPSEQHSEHDVTAPSAGRNLIPEITTTSITGKTMKSLAGYLDPDKM
jgi:hypothetical protein